MAEEKIVVMTATELEQRPLRDRLGDWERAGRRVVWRVGGMGAGAMAAATVAAVRAERPGVVVLVGIGGARPGVSLEVAETVLVGSDRQADLGAWRSETGRFEPFDGWAEEAETIVCPYAEWLRDRFRVAGARSVNAACAPVPWRDGEEVESMEGAAFSERVGWPGWRFCSFGLFRTGSATGAMLGGFRRLCAPWPMHSRGC